MLTSPRIIPGFIGSEELKSLHPKEATPNLKLIKTPLTAETSLELWQPKVNFKETALLASETPFLKQEFLRVHKVIAKMIWLMGAICIAEDEWAVGKEHQNFYNWQQVINFVRKEGQCYNPVVTNFVFHSHSFNTIKQNAFGTATKSLPQAWEIAPAHWLVTFDDFVQKEGTFYLKPLKSFISVEIWTGQPLRRNIKTGQFSVNYYDRHNAKRF